MLRLPKKLFLPAALGVVVLLVTGMVACGDNGNATSKRLIKPHLVELGDVLRAPVRYAAERAGSLRALRQVKLFNQAEGQVDRVLVREGDNVRAGQVLAKLDARILRAELRKAAATRRQAEVELNNLKKLAVKKLVSDNALERAQTTFDIAHAEESVFKTRVSYMTIRAPFAGIVAARLVEPGDIAPKHTHLLTLVDPKQLVTDVQVSELLIARLNIGDRAEVRIDALGDTVYTGKILRIYPTIDPATRLGRIEVVLKPVPKGARAGHFCRVTLYSSGTRSLVVPSTAVRRDTVGEFVFIADEKNHAKRVSVLVGLRFADKVEIQSGLIEGQQVVIKGFIGLEEGQNLKVVNIKPDSKTPPATGNKSKRGA